MSMFMNWLLFIANLLIAGVVIRLIETKYADSRVGAALSFAY